MWREGVSELGLKPCAPRPVGMMSPDGGSTDRIATSRGSRWHSDFSKHPCLSTTPTCRTFELEEQPASLPPTVEDSLAGSSLSTPTVTSSASPPLLSSSSSFFRLSVSFSRPEITSSFCAHSALYLESCSTSSLSAARLCS